jgi:chromosome segregation ATPase
LLAEPIIKAKAENLKHEESLIELRKEEAEAQKTREKLDAERKSKDAEDKKYENDFKEIEREYKVMLDNAAEIDARLRSADARKKALEKDISKNSEFAAMRRIDEMRENNEFRGKVIYPLLLDIGIPDQRFVAQVENGIGYKNLWCCVCENSDDNKVLFDIMQKFKVRTKIIKVNTTASIG